MDVTLRLLREYRGMAQREVAKNLGVQQPAVSKMEHSTAISFMGVVNYLRALGGDIELRVRFPDRSKWRLL